MGTAEKLLKLVLYATGVVCGSAVVALFMPRSWMAWGHAQLGMGAFPEQGVAEYLARETSGLYAFYGILLLFLAQDVRRYAPLIAYQALAIAGVSIVATIYGGMPAYWLAADTAGACAAAVATLALQAAVRSADRRKAALAGAA